MSSTPASLVQPYMSHSIDLEAGKKHSMDDAAVLTHKKSLLHDSYDDEEEKGIDDLNQTTVHELKLTYLERFAAKLNAETKGIDIITDEEKHDEPSLWGAALMWLSANLVIATYALGALGVTVFGLSFWQSVLTIIFFTLFGVLPVAWLSIFGPKLGLRQMVLLKFLVGDVTMRIFSVINMVACVGWGAVNIMSSAQLLHMVNDGAVPPWAACLVFIGGTILVTFFGYHVIHMYEKWSFIPNVAVLIAIIVQLARAQTFTFGEMKGGPTTAGNVLSFGGAVYGFATGWTTYALDYTVYQPRNVPGWKIFFSIILGLWPPLLFTMILGAASATGTLTNARWMELYQTKSVGGLVYAILVEDSLHGFGQFLMVVFSLSTIANNIPNMYLIALSAQSVHHWFEKVPRIFWTIFANFVTLAIAIPGYYEFEQVMDNFMNMIGYYLAIYQSIFLSEHFVWNKNNYEYEYWRYKDRKAYPIGIAGTFGFCCGVAGVVVGMNQVWYLGPIGKLIGEHGGDIGSELGFGFAFVGYNLVRPLELKYIGR